MEKMSEVYQHIKTGGLYVKLLDATDETSERAAVVYKSLGNGNVWVRPASEFYDSLRFKNLGPGVMEHTRSRLVKVIAETLSKIDVRTHVRPD